MNALIAVIVAFLANGEMNYAAVDADDIDDCKAKVAQIAHQRLAANATEAVKVLGFSYKCVEFENTFPPIETPPAPKPPHVPGKDEARAVY